MNYVVFPSVAVANTFAASIDSRLGYPRVGVDFGRGPHVVPTFVTQRHGLVEKHPTRNQWCYPDDAPVTALRAVVPLPPGAQSRARTPSWTPPPPAPRGGRNGA